MLKCYRALEIYIPGQVDMLNKTVKLSYKQSLLLWCNLPCIAAYLVVVILVGVGKDLPTLQYSLIGTGTYSQEASTRNLHRCTCAVCLIGRLCLKISGPRNLHRIQLHSIQCEFLVQFSWLYVTHIW